MLLRLAFVCGLPQVTLALRNRTADPNVLRAAATVTLPARCEKCMDSWPTTHLSEPMRVVPSYGPGAYASRFTAAHRCVERNDIPRAATGFVIQGMPNLEGAVVSRIVGCEREAGANDLRGQERLQVNAVTVAGDNY